MFEKLLQPIEMPLIVFFLIIGLALAGSLICLLSLFLFGQNPIRRLRWKVYDENVLIDEFSFWNLKKAINTKRTLKGIKIKLGTRKETKEEK